jgi:hypothetical protein
MKLIKSRNRALLTDKHLNSLMTVAVTELKPDIDKLVKCSETSFSLKLSYTRGRLITYPFLQPDVNECLIVD